MSWDITLLSSGGGPVSVDPFTAGSTYPIGGTGDADITVTYNYAKFFYQAIDSEHGLRWLNGKTGADTAQRLRIGVDKLTDEGEEINNYWASTPYNAKCVLRLLASWAEMHPQGTWSIT